MTERQYNHFNKAKRLKTGLRLDLSAAVIKDIAKSGGIFPLLAGIQALIAAAAPAVAKAAALCAVGTAAGMALKKASGQGISKKGERSKTSGNSPFVVRKGSKTRNSSMIVPLSNFDLLNAVERLNIKNFRGDFVRDQLPKQPNNTDTGIINLDKKIWTRHPRGTEKV